MIAVAGARVGALGALLTCNSSDFTSAWGFIQPLCSWCGCVVISSSVVARNINSYLDHVVEAVPSEELCTDIFTLPSTCALPTLDAQVLAVLVSGDSRAGPGTTAAKLATAGCAVLMVVW